MHKACGPLQKKAMYAATRLWKKKGRSEFLKLKLQNPEAAYQTIAMLRKGKSSVIVQHHLKNVVESISRTSRLRETESRMRVDFVEYHYEMKRRRGWKKAKCEIKWEKLKEDAALSLPKKEPGKPLTMLMPCNAVTAKDELLDFKKEAKGTPGEVASRKNFKAIGADTMPNLKFKKAHLKLKAASRKRRKEEEEDEDEESDDDGEGEDQESEDEEGTEIEEGVDEDEEDEDVNSDDKEKEESDDDSEEQEDSDDDSEVRGMIAKKGRGRGRGGSKPPRESPRSKTELLKELRGYPTKHLDFRNGNHLIVLNERMENLLKTTADSFMVRFVSK